jgi:hypothetical protein
MSAVLTQPWGSVVEPWGSALLAGVLSFASPKESSQRKGDPEGGAGVAGSLRYSAGRAAAELGLRPQTVLAESPRPSCVAQRLPRGPQRRPRPTDVAQKTGFHGQPEKRAKNEIFHSGTQAQAQIVSPGPLRGAEQHRKAGGLRRGLFEGRSPEFRSRPAFRVAQGTGAAGTDPGVAFSLATFFWPHKRKYARQQGGNPSQLTGTPGQSTGTLVLQMHPTGAPV